MKNRRFLIVIVVLALSACRPSPGVGPTVQIGQEQATIPPTPTTLPPTPSPQPKLDELVTAAMEGWSSDQINPDQVELTIAYYADDAVFKMVGFPPTTPSEFQGKEAIRAAFESWIPLHPKLEVKIEAVEGDTVIATTSYWSDPVRAMKVAPLVGKDVYVFVDGRIASQTWTLTEESQNKFASAIAAATTPTPSPETLAASLDELIGTWQGRWSDTHVILFEVKEGGRSRTYFTNGDDIDRATLKFENGKLIFPTVTGTVPVICKENPRGEYTVYVTKQGEKIVQLRFELVGEDYCADRKEFLNGRKLTPVKP
jgi:ketosteroid isomerase-like protein